MNENNELNDIILNKGNSASSNKKIILAVATLGVVLIIVVMLMNSLSSSSNENLPQAVLPPKPQMQQSSPVADEPLFEEVEVVNDSSSSDADLDQIAKKLKAESLKEDEVPEVIQNNEVTTIIPEAKAQKSIATIVPSKHQKTTTPKAVTKGTHYVQVGSFSKYQPNKKFLSKITKLGYSFTYHKVGSLNKVLVGPFTTTANAKKARKVLRSKVEPGAFLVHL